ncbi:uncharacterized protein ACNLHF_018563 [Anomaloglossus baeobatrachus]|uniref:uncharacterized protein LOC142310200 n=1 Tax=Anomaloglossus baeobatrachus TaxID=238106 RepID=UPI003F4FB740
MGTLVSRVQGLCDRMKLRKVTIVMIGLDGSGKTTILYRLKQNEAVTTYPTATYNVETLDIFENLSLVIWDVSLGAKGGPLKRHFLECCQGFMFVVDSTDTERFYDAHDDLYYAVTMDSQALPFIVLANKQDLDGACSPPELVNHLKLHHYPARQWDICGCSGLTGEGVREALEKMCKMIKENER